uniref:HAT C-terminal dimerisation domain-containing protein n=1 Tax=Solanum lycopersicum TaxID=4081 RepID=A0A3Q7GGE1_SOLLC
MGSTEKTNNNSPSEGRSCVRPVTQADAQRQLQLRLAIESVFVRSDSVFVSISPVPVKSVRNRSCRVPKEERGKIRHEEGQLQDPILPRWKNRENQFPTLANIVRDVLAIQASSVASEQTFRGIWAPCTIKKGLFGLFGTNDFALLELAQTSSRAPFTVKMGVFDGLNFSNTLSAPKGIIFVKSTTFVDFSMPVPTLRIGLYGDAKSS